MRSDQTEKYDSKQPATIKLEVIKEELSNCLALSGYMASASIVKSYLEKRVFALENEVRLNDITAHAYSSNKDEIQDSDWDHPEELPKDGA